MEAADSWEPGAAYCTRSRAATHVQCRSRRCCQALATASTNHNRDARLSNPGAVAAVSAERKLSADD